MEKTTEALSPPLSLQDNALLKPVFNETHHQNPPPTADKADIKTQKAKQPLPSPAASQHPSGAYEPSFFQTSSSILFFKLFNLPLWRIDKTGKGREQALLPLAFFLTQGKQQDMNPSNKEKSSSMGSQKRSLKEEIAEKAFELFKERGAKSVTMDEVSACMGISKRTLYETFADKEDLLLFCLRKQKERDEQLFKKLSKANGNILETMLKWYRITIKERNAVNPKFFSDIYKYSSVLAFIENDEKERRKSSLSFFKLGIEQGLFFDDINYEILDAIVSNAARQLFKAEHDEGFSFTQTYNTLTLTLLRGITTQKGRNILEKFLNDSNESLSKRDTTMRQTQKD